jgi:hypothetical protein
VLTASSQPINPKKPNWREKTMKTIKAICTAAVLALTLSISAFAGDIAAPGAPKTVDFGTTGAVSTELSASSTGTTVVASDLQTAALSEMLTLLSFF